MKIYLKVIRFEKIKAIRFFKGAGHLKKKLFLLFNMASEEEEAYDFTEDLFLNCGEKPNLNDLELHQLSDNINYICNDLLFASILSDETNRLNFDKVLTSSYKPGDSISGNEVVDEILFPTANGGNPIYLKKMIELESALTKLSEVLEDINTKKETAASMQMPLNLICLGYLIFWVYSLKKYYDLKTSDDLKERSQAEEYNIGFASSFVYLIAAYLLKDQAIEYNKIYASSGELDSSVCSKVADMITELKSIYKCSLTFKADGVSEQQKTDCRTSILKSMYHVYFLKYVKNIFIAAKSEYRESVNKITGFVDKQKKFLLKKENVDVSFPTDNESLEEFYRVVLYNTGTRLFVESDTPQVTRKQLYESKECDQSGVSKTCETYDQYLKQYILKAYIDLLTLKTDDSLKNLMIEVKEIYKRNLPEYDEIIYLIFPKDLSEYNRTFNKEGYLKYLYEELDRNEPNIVFDDWLKHYFEDVYELHESNGLFSVINNTIDSDNTSAIMLTKLQKRKSNELISVKKYKQFQIKFRTSLLLKDDFDDESKFKSTYMVLRDYFADLTSEYPSITKSIVMKHFTSYVNDDEQIVDVEVRGIIKSNFEFLSQQILTSLQISQKLKNDLFENRGVNTSKYISFMKFESKINQLEGADVIGLQNYISGINDTLRLFRKYIKSEEIFFSKRFQIISVYEDSLSIVFWASFVLLLIHFYDIIAEGRDPLEMLRDLKKVGKDIKKTSSNILDKSRSTLNSIRSTRKKPNQVEQTFAAPGATVYQSAKTTFGKGGNEPKSEQESKTESKTESENALNIQKQSLFQDKWIQISFQSTAFMIVYTFVSNYLIKYKADVNYDKIVNVINTTKFEHEFERFKKSFDVFVSERSSKNCKVMYHSLIEVIEAYGKCNFVKSGMRSTPFPGSEMLTNITMIVIFISIIYIAYTGTGANKYFDNRQQLERILKDIQDLESGSDTSALMERSATKRTKQVKTNMKEFQKRLDQPVELTNKTKQFIIKVIKYLNDKTFMVKSDTVRFKKFIGDLQSEELTQVKFDEIKNKVLEYVNVQLEANTNEMTDEIVGAGMHGGTQATQQPQMQGLQMPMPIQMPMQMPVMYPVNNDATMQKQMLREYERRYNNINSQMISMQRNSEYLNVVMAFSIFFFGAYFTMRIQAQTQQYKSMLNSGGTYQKDCL